MAFPLALGAGLLGGGLLSSIGGSLFGASEAEKRRKMMMSAANMPGVNIQGETASALGNIMGNLPMATNIAGQANMANLGNMQSLFEKSMPGYAARKGQEFGLTESMIRGELPMDVQQRIQQNAAVRALGGGYGGTGMGRNLLARDLGLTSLDLMQRGLQLQPQLTKQYAGMEAPNPLGVQSFFGLTPAEQIQLKNTENARKQQLMAQAAGMQGAGDVWGGMLGQMGGTAMGLGAMGLLGNVMNRPYDVGNPEERLSQRLWNRWQT